MHMLPGFCNQNLGMDSFVFNQATLEVCETGACKARYFGSEVKGAAGAALKAAQTKLKECQQNKGRSFLNKSRTKRRLYPPT